MSKHYLLKIPVLVWFMFNCIAVSFAQDTVKKANTVKPAIAKPAVKYAPAAKLPYAPRHTYLPPSAADSALIKDKTLNGQYQYLLTKLYRYQTPLVAALWKNVRDTLTIERRLLNQVKSQLAEQGQTITGLKTDVTSKDQILNVSNTKMDSISLLGIPFTKATYNLVMWGLVIVFGAIAAIVIARSGAHSREARYRVKLYEELDEEYKAYKSKANEKEKKLARELQTERNKLDELLGRG